MNIIRTKAVELSAIPAIAYKQKLAAGGAGVKVLRMDMDASAVVTIDKRGGDWIPYGPLNEDLFPVEAIDEAIELTSGLPFSARGNIKVVPVEVKVKEDVVEDAPAEQLDMTMSKEYQMLIDRYCDEKGKLNYNLMNKDFIQFAAKSQVVADMINADKSRDEIVNFIVRSRVGNITKMGDLDQQAAELLIESLDEIDPRSAFKELKAFLTRLTSRKSNKGRKS